MKSDWSATIPPTRTTGDAPAGGVAGDMNLVRAALTEIRSFVPNAAAEVGAATTGHTHPENGIPATLFDAKGDSLWATAADVAARLAVGSTLGQVLAVDPAAATGVAWGAGGGLLAVNAQTASYTPVLTDMGKVVLINSASAATFTIPPNSSVAFPVTAQLGWRQRGAGQITVAAGAGVTLNTPGTLTTRARYSEMWAHQVSANEWDISGDMS